MATCNVMDVACRGEPTENDLPLQVLSVQRSLVASLSSLFWFYGCNFTLWWGPGNLEGIGRIGHKAQCEGMGEGVVQQPWSPLTG